MPDAVLPAALLNSEQVCPPKVKEKTVKTSKLIHSLEARRD